MASNYTDKDLSETKSMWSLIELGSFDKDVDEKQENMDVLIKCLMDNGYVEVANKLFQLNNKARDRIKAYLITRHKWENKVIELLKIICEF